MVSDGMMFSAAKTRKLRLACPASAYQSIITDGYAWQDYRAAPDPDIAPYVDWAAKLQPGGPPSCIAWVIGREDLNPWADLRLVLNRNLHDVEDDAVEMQEHARTEPDAAAPPGGRCDGASGVFATVGLQLERVRAAQAPGA
jgi:hypothetical protein